MQKDGINRHIRSVLHNKISDRQNGGRKGRKVQTIQQLLHVKALKQRKLRSITRRLVISRCGWQEMKSKVVEI